MPLLRVMRDADLQQINLVQSKAFTHARISAGHSAGQVPLIRHQFLSMYHNANPGGSFVIEENSRILAYCFSRKWGKVSWIGPLAVLPSEQHKGLGRQIILATIEHLKKQDCTTIGLELEASSYNNVGFYVKLGFRLRGLALDLVKEINADPNDEESFLTHKYYSRVANKERDDLLYKLRKLSGSLHSGLDYTGELNLCLSHGFGDGLFLLDGQRLKAFMLAHTEPYSDTENREFLKINITLVDHKEEISFLSSVAAAAQKWARESALSFIYLRMPVYCDQALAFLINNGFRVARNDIRMTLADYDLKYASQQIGFSKWE